MENQKMSRQSIKNKKKKKLISNCQMKKKNEKKKECMRKLRESIRNDPEKYEEQKRKERERYYARKEAGKIKGIHEISSRDQRNIRKKWRERSKKYYLKKKSNEKLALVLKGNTPPPSPVPGPSGDSTIHRSRLEEGKKKRRKNFQCLKNKIKELEKKLKNAKAFTAKYRQKFYRKNEKYIDTPQKKVKKLLTGHTVSPVVRKKLLFSEVIASQIKENFNKDKCYRNKHNVAVSVSGKIVKKYRCLHYMKKILSVRTLRHIRDTKEKSQTKKHIEAIKVTVSNFLQEDESSRLCPGKKNTITLKKSKQQKRLLTDSLENLHQKFLHQYPQFKISYSLFCKLRPFWVLMPKAKDRDTCACITHENMAFIIAALKQKGIIKENSPIEVCKALCCEGEYLKEYCLIRSCNSCQSKKIQFQDFERERAIAYQRWITKKIKIIVKGEERMCQKTVKEEVICSQEQLVSILEGSVINFLMHVRNMTHQQSTMNSIKKQLTLNDVLIHADFSENYLCKYGREVQSAHFGGSKQQISLHTVVVYNLCPDTLELKTTSYCSLSDSLRHDPSAICAHLKPIIMEIKHSHLNLKTAHIFTDSPTTQYRNRKMFYLMAMYLAPELGVDVLNWHYTESGHGKGAPDGVGGCLKRIADSLVGRGKDLHNFNTFADELTVNSKKINVIKIASKCIENIDKLLPRNIAAFKGTMRIHQITWTKEDPFILQARHLSCLLCSPGEWCTHHGIGVINLPVNYSRNIERHIKIKQVYSDCDSFSDTSDENFFGPVAEISNSKITTQISPNSYIVVKFATKKSFKYFIALVLSCDSTDEYTVKFMKKCTANKFVFPAADDIAEVNADDIVDVLSQPIMNKREQYIFKDNLDTFVNLC